MKRQNQPEEGRQDCPICGGSNTLKVSYDNGKLLLECYQCAITDRGEWFKQVLSALGAAPTTGQRITPKATKPKPTHAEAATEARKIWAAAKPADPDHPYLVRKGVEPHGLRQDRRGHLVSPLYDIDGKITCLQTIDQNGKKMFSPGGVTKGSFCTSDCKPIGQVETVHITEGTATAATVKEATGMPTVCAYNAGNLLPVATAIRERCPNTDIVICGDDDRFKDKNPGREKAIEAALALGCKVCFPAFLSDDDKPTDFNDLHQREGLETVKAQIEAAMMPEADNNELNIIQAKVEKLSKMEPISRDIERKKLMKEYGISAAAINEAIKNIQAETQPDTSASIVSDITLWTETVDGARLLSEISSIISTFAIVPKHMDSVLALWVVLTYCYNIFRILPQIAIYSPEKRCGKSTLLEILHALVFRGLIASNISPAAVYRTIEKYQPCLFIDEADTFYKDNDELRGICNSGHTKKTAFVIRTEGDNHDPVKFSTWGPKVIALIGELSDTQHDRSIVVNMRRKLPGEQVQRLPLDLEEDCLIIRQKCKRWADDNLDLIMSVMPKVPETGNDRQQDNWSPLFAIAECMGAGWLDKVQNALISVTEEVDDSDSIAIRLLRDIQETFKNSCTDKLSSEKLVEELIGLKDSPWSDWSRGRGFSQNSLSRQLKHFKIRPFQLRIGGEKTRGYSLDQFSDSFKRYLPPLHPPKQSGTTVQPNNCAGFPGFQGGTRKNAVPVENPLKPIPRLSCTAVPVDKGGCPEEKPQARKIVNSDFWEV